MRQGRQRFRGRLKLLSGQIVAVGAVIGDCLVLLAQRLGDFEGLFRIEVVVLAHFGLQVQQGKG
ncbi:hypothetical protein D3C80_2192910 [compost metagenome]